MKRYLKKEGFFVSEIGHPLGCKLFQRGDLLVGDGRTISIAGSGSHKVQGGLHIEGRRKGEGLRVTDAMALEDPHRCVLRPKGAVTGEGREEGQSHRCLVWLRLCRNLRPPPPPNRCILRPRGET